MKATPRMNVLLSLAWSTVLYACSGPDHGGATASAELVASSSAAGTSVAGASGTLALAGNGVGSSGAGGSVGVGSSAADSGGVGGVGVARSGPEGGAAPNGGARTFTAVLAIFMAEGHACAACHGDPPGQGDGGLSFDPSQRAASYQALVGVQSPGANGSLCGGKTYVVPGSPDMSLLYDKVANATPSCGARMPASGRPLTAAEIATMRNWISAGAPND